MQELEEENSSLRSTLETQEKTQEDLEEKSKALATTVTNLRGLVCSLIKDADTKARDDTRVAKALQQLELQSVLIDSEPPLD